MKEQHKWPFMVCNEGSIINENGYHVDSVSHVPGPVPNFIYDTHLNLWY